MMYIPVSYPPRDPRKSLTLTLYWTRMPRFSFWAVSVTLSEKNMRKQCVSNQCR